MLGFECGYLCEWCVSVCFDYKEIYGLEIIRLNNERGRWCGNSFLVVLYFLVFSFRFYRLELRLGKVGVFEVVFCIIFIVR